MTPMLFSLLEILAGFILLVWAADRLVAGASALARIAGVSPLVVGLTVVGFGTSAPEMVVSAMASLQGNPSLALGNAIGSNISNMALILGLTALVYPLRIESGALKREFPVLGLVMLLTLILMWDLELGRLDGTILALGLLSLLGCMVWLGIKRGEDDPLARTLAEEIPSGMPAGAAAAWTLLGLVLLPLSSHILVEGAVSLASMLGVSDAVIGLTVVAIGTSLPELAAAMASALKKEDDLAIGNIIGSNMFNLLGVLGIAALVQPMAISPELLYRDTAVMFLITGLLFVLGFRTGGPGLISRRGGAVLFACFLGYMALVTAQSLPGGTA